MSQPDAYELARLRDDLEAVSLPDTCIILSPTNTADGQGGYSTSWGTAASGVTCRLDAKPEGGEGVTGAATNPYYGYTLTIPYDQAIASNYRVVVGASTFNVVSIDADKSWAIDRRVYLERV